MANFVDSTFESLGLSDWLIEQCKIIGYKTPTPIQHSCVPRILNGKFLIFNSHANILVVQREVLVFRRRYHRVCKNWFRKDSCICIANHSKIVRGSVRHICIGSDTNSVGLPQTAKPSTAYLTIRIFSELAYQIADQFRILGKPINIKDCVITGGLGKHLF